MKSGNKYLILLTIFILVFLTACSSSGDGDNNIDGDAELEPEIEFEPEIEETNEGREAERPEEEKFIWQDDTINEWTETAFCVGTKPFLHEDFEDGTYTESPEWKIDKSEGNDQSVDPKIIEINDKYMHVLSGTKADVGSEKPAARIYRELPKIANSYHVMSKLVDNSSRNYIWLNNDEAPAGAWVPEIRIFHESDDSGKQKIRIIDQYDKLIDKCEVEVDNSWHKIELYQISSISWQLDVDRVTACNFIEEIEPTKPLKYIFLGAGGYMDEILIGSCDKPKISTACKDSSDCVPGEVCGRNGICGTSRTISCKSNNQCHDESSCLRETGAEGTVGEGTCSVLCTKHADCRPDEICVPRTKEGGYCQSLCAKEQPEEFVCPKSQSCYDVAGVSGCLPDNCKANAEWMTLSSGLMECNCSEGFTFDPFTYRCEEEKTCKTHKDCNASYKCGNDICYRNRDISCQNDDACPAQTSCYGYILDEAIAGRGICVQNCVYQDDCLPYENCIPITDTKWSCLQTCDTDEDCSQGLLCMTSFDKKHCMVKECQTNGEWQWSEDDQQFVCTCVNGTTLDPQTKKCF